MSHIWLATVLATYVPTVSAASCGLVWDSDVGKEVFDCLGKTAAEEKALHSASQYWEEWVSAEDFNKWVSVFKQHADGTVDVVGDCILLFGEDFDGNPPMQMMQRTCALIIASRYLPINFFDDYGPACNKPLDLGRLNDAKYWVRVAEKMSDEDHSFLIIPWSHKVGVDLLELFLLDQGFEKLARDSLNVANMMLSRTFSMAPDEAEQFSNVTSHLVPATGELLTVCIDGVTLSAMESPCFIHFAWGHIGAVISALAREGLLNTRLRLIFSHQLNFCPLSTWIQFYGIITDELPTFDPLCEGAEKVIKLVSPIHVHYESPANEAKVTEEAWTQFLADCQLRPMIFPRLMARFGLSTRDPESPLMFLWQHKGSKGSVARTTKNTRDIYNYHEVKTAIEKYAVRHGWNVLEVDSGDSPWHEQVTTIMQTDVLLSMHGSAVGAHELWLHPGSVVIEVLMNNTCHCPYAYCAAANPERDITWVLATSRGTNCSMGDWVGQASFDSGSQPVYEKPELVWPSWDDWNVARSHGREFSAERILQGLAFPGAGSISARFRAWALRTLPGGGRACGGMAVQVED